MARDRWHPDADAVEEVRAFLRGPVSASRPGSLHRLPRLREVLCTHIEDGFVHLGFLGWPLAEARAVADQLLHPDALLVSGPGVQGAAAPAFEGFGWDDDPPEAVLARRSGPHDPPSLHAARTVPVATDSGAPDWGEQFLS